MKTLLYIILFNISAISFAQDPQLFENPWYLHKINIDNVDYFLPNLEPISFEEHIFTDIPYKFYTGYCDSVDPLVTYDNQSSTFYLQDSPMIVPGDFCSLPENYTFNSQYFSILYGTNLIAKNPISYIITTNGSNKSLLITNPEGDKAYYGNEKLFVQNFDAITLYMYPNPVRDKLYLSLRTLSANLILKIFNIDGKLLSAQNVELTNQASINVSQLKSGIYFLNIEDENGNTAIKKFIKE